MFEDIQRILTRPDSFVSPISKGHFIFEIHHAEPNWLQKKTSAHQKKVDNTSKDAAYQRFDITWQIIQDLSSFP
jgi:hypothetical protein